MAYYENQSEVTLKASDIFKPTYKPGMMAPRSGIYVCVNCRDEIAANKGDPLPPQNHRQHPNTAKPIEWQLLVCTQPGPST